MEIVKGYRHLTRPLVHPVVSIGNFDGVHLGHQQIIQAARKKAKSRGGECVVYTFRPHPQVALRPDSNVQLLSTYDERVALLRQSGADLLIEEPFSREFSQTEPVQFFNDVLLHQLSVEAIVVGYDFAFGRQRHGHLEALTDLCKSANIDLEVVKPQKHQGEVVSSTRIREYLLSDQVSKANTLLGRPFSYQGVVIKGEGRGRKIGFPTANLKIENKLTLPYGVYATEVLYKGDVFASVTNVGVRPTFNADTKDLPALVETHVFDQSFDLYGSTLEVRFFEMIRKEIKFSSVEQLIEQIKVDSQKSRDILAKR